MKAQTRSRIECLIPTSHCFIYAEIAEQSSFVGRY